MGILAKFIKEPPKANVPFTTLTIHVQSMDHDTTLLFVPAEYSVNGFINKTIEIPSLDEPYDQIYKELYCWGLSHCMEMLSLADDIYQMCLSHNDPQYMGLLEYAVNAYYNNIINFEEELNNSINK